MRQSRRREMIVPTPTPSTDRPRVQLLPAGALRAFTLVTGLFFLWGIPNNLNDLLIRQFMKSFAISRFQQDWCNRLFTWDIFFWHCRLGC